MHGKPAQQSASVVQVPPDSTQLGPQMNGGSPSPALTSGKQGSPQQSALEAQAMPARESASSQSPAAEQRGIPSRSCWHTLGSTFTLPAQQLFSAAHWYCASLQI